MKKILYLVQLCFLTAVIACHTIQTTRVDNTPSERQSVYEDLKTPGAIQGVGIESQDIASMTDKMMRDMLATPSLTNRSIAPRVIIDAEYFVNESSSTINKKMITERLMVNLNRASSGRMVFLERAAFGVHLALNTKHPISPLTGPLLNGHRSALVTVTDDARQAFCPNPTKLHLHLLPDPDGIQGTIGDLAGDPGAAIQLHNSHGVGSFVDELTGRHADNCVGQQRSGLR